MSQNTPDWSMAVKSARDTLCLRYIEQSMEITYELQELVKRYGDRIEELIHNDLKNELEDREASQLLPIFLPSSESAVNIKFHAIQLYDLGLISEYVYSLCMELTFEAYQAYLHSEAKLEHLS